MEKATYIHGTDAAEQERLARLNALTNPPFLRFLQLRETDAVLEVGSGLGLLAGEVAKQVPHGEVIGLEFSAQQLARASRTTPNLHFVRGDAHALPFADGRFDLVYCRYVLEHLWSPQRALEEMRRVLKPGGRALVQENDMRVVIFDPDCPATETLIEKMSALQSQLGGDARVGKRLFGLFRRAGFDAIELSFEPEIYPATSPHFRLWIENIIHILQGAAGHLLAKGLATEKEIEAALSELSGLLERDDACALFHWNRAVGRNRNDENDHDSR